MRFLCFLALLAVASCNEKQPAAPLLPREIPVEVKEYLGRQLPGWQVVDTPDYSPAWWSFYDRRQLPYFVTLDVNDDQQADHAVLMKRGGAFLLAVLLFEKNGGFTHQLFSNLPASGSGNGNKLTCGLTVEPPAQIDVVYPQESSLLLHSNAITVMDLEQRARIYYWQNDSLITFYAK